MDAAADLTAFATDLQAAVDETIAAIQRLEGQITDLQNEVATLKAGGVDTGTAEGIITAMRASVDELKTNLPANVPPAQ